MHIQELTEELNRKITVANARGELTAAEKRALMNLMSNILTAVPAPDWLDAYLVEKR